MTRLPTREEVWEYMRGIKENQPEWYEHQLNKVSEPDEEAMLEAVWILLQRGDYQALWRDGRVYHIAQVKSTDAWHRTFPMRDLL